MKTAHEFLEENSENYTDILPDGVEYFHMVSDKVLIEFAKMHLKKANEEAKKYLPYCQKNTELYPLENIK